MADSSSSKSVEPAENICQVSDALKVINDITNDITSKVLVNNHQCKRIADRFDAIGMTLKEWLTDSVSGSGLDAENDPAFGRLLTVLRKGNVLVSKYSGLKASMPNLLTRSPENREAFKEIHVELDTLGSRFLFESYTSGSGREDMLKADADADLKEISEISLDNVSRTTDKSCTEQGTDGAAVSLEDLKTLNEVVSDKMEANDEEDSVGKLPVEEELESVDLPGYLKIETSAVDVKPPVREFKRQSNQDPLKTDGWARVHRGIWIGCDCAVKVFKSGMTKWDREQQLMEVRSLVKLHHPHIVQCIGFAQDKEKCLILMELMDNDLRHFMESKKSRPPHQEGPFSSSEELDIITQIAKGMHYLHTQKYVHGELKCSNILVKDFGDFIEVKIADLRRSQKLGEFDAEAFDEARTTTWRPRWTAPEVYSYSKDNPPTHDLLTKTDVYSFGMVCYEVVTGNWPFHGIRDRDHLMKEIRNGKRPGLPDNLDGNLKKLIEECWKSDPKERPTFEVICHQLDYIRSSQLFRVVKSVVQHFKRCLYPPANTHWSSIIEKGQSSRKNSHVELPAFVRIDPAKLKRKRLIKSGSSAEVYKTTWLGCNFAEKKFKSKLTIEALQIELKFLIELRHPFIVRLMGLSVQPDRECSIVMELMHGDLRDVINDRIMSRKAKRTEGTVAPFDLLDAVRIITKIALGMAFLHFRNVTHRDLKALNILIRRTGHSQQTDSVYDVKIADFGLSHIILQDAAGDLETPDGTLFWRAPEILRPAERKVDYTAVDVYAFAMTCYEILTGGTPLEHLNATDHQAVTGGARPILPSDLNPDLKQLIEESWDGEPGKRPTFPNICERLRKICKGLEHPSP